MMSDGEEKRKVILWVLRYDKLIMIKIDLG